MYRRRREINTFCPLFSGAGRVKSANHFFGMTFGMLFGSLATSSRAMGAGAPFVQFGALTAVPMLGVSPVLSTAAGSGTSPRVRVHWRLEARRIAIEPLVRQTCQWSLGPRPTTTPCSPLMGFYLTARLIGF